MWFDVFFEKGKMATSRTPSQRQSEVIRIKCDSIKEEDIKKAAQLAMRRKGMKGFRFRKWKLAAVPMSPYPTDFQRADKKIEIEFKMSLWEMKALHNALVETYRQELTGHNLLRERLYQQIQLEEIKKNTM